jgi:hypothetical protein
MNPGLSSGRGVASVGVAQRAMAGERGRLLARLEPLLTGWAARCLALTAAYVGFGYAVAAALALPLHWPIVYLFAQAKWIFFLTYAPLVLGYALASAGHERAVWPRFRGFLLSPRFFLEFAVAMVAVHATIMVFVNLKQYLPAVNEMLYDGPLWRLDAWLHLGIDPAVVATELAAEHGLLPWLDRAYVLYYPAQVVVPLLFLLATRLRPRRGRFFFAYCLIWILGGLVYFAWPSLGPVYYWPSRFVWLDQAPYAQYLQDLLMRDYVRFRTDPSYYTVKLYQGVAALPSLHVGVLTLFAIACRPWRALAVALWILTAVTFVGSMALGWHYAVDGYAGALIAWLAWWVACRLVREEPADVPAAVPAGGAPAGGAPSRAVRAESA